MVGLVAALAAACVILATNAASDGHQSPPETGYPSHLINVPTHGTGNICEAPQRLHDACGDDFLNLNPEME
jgi:hypothetical protein